MYFEEAERIWCDTPHGIVNREPAGAIARLEARGVRVGQPDGDPDFHFDKVCVLTAPDSLREEFLAEVAPMCQVIDRGNMLELPVRGIPRPPAAWRWPRPWGRTWPTAMPLATAPTTWRCCNAWDTRW
ncbi:MAG: hypothetical protein ACLR5H_00925 [Oscillospiraceae bacterium]